MRALRVLWAAPYSLIGLLLCLGFRRRRLTHGVLLCEGAEWPRKLGWRYRAITFGHVVLCIDDIDDRVLAHELAHVRQYESWGPFFVPAYLLAALWAVLRRRHPYRDNHFEVAARAEVSGGHPVIR
ncbi:MAG: signal peptide prediction [Actinomycetota bacterium]